MDGIAFADEAALPFMRVAHVHGGESVSGKDVAGAKQRDIVHRWSPTIVQDRRCAGRAS